MCEYATALQLVRHDMVCVDPAAWETMVAERADLQNEPLIADWAECGWPLVVRRPACADSVDRVALGLPLPPAYGKKRIAVRLPAIAIRNVAPPPRLVDVVPLAPSAWRETINRLLRLDDRVRSYGSLAWQHLTGLPYLSDASDLDLLWQYDRTSSSEALLAAILGIERLAPMRIDGELVASDGAAVNWRELHSAASSVLAKYIDRIELLPREQFLPSGRGE